MIARRLVAEQGQRAGSARAARNRRRDNIWPQCGRLAKRYFKQKDMVENHLANIVRTQVSDLRQLANYQKLIAEDSTQLLPFAQQWCPQSGNAC